MKAISDEENKAVKKASTKGKRVQGDRAGILLWIAFSIVALAAWVVGKMELYTSGSDFGYNLGLVGGIMMLVLLTYPISKRVKAMQRLVSLKYWFQGHMVLGMLGPIIILFHSNMQLNSFNGGVAFISMLAVFLSGLVGRFIYTRIHLGLYGKKASLGDLKASLGVQSEETHSRFHFVPSLDKRLTRFEAYFADESVGIIGRTIRFFAFPPMMHWTYYKAGKELRRAIKKHAKKRGWERARVRQRVDYGKAMIREYLRMVQHVVQFNTYEKLLSFWHFAHVPLIFLLVVSAVIHVLAVHMY